VKTDSESKPLDNATSATCSDPAVEFHEKVSGLWQGLYDKSSFGERAQLIARLIEKANQSNGQEDSHWLDAGCGTGNLSSLLVQLGQRVTGVDASPGMLANARANVTEDLATFSLIETIEALPFEDESFDNVLCSSVVEYVPNPKKCLSEFSRVLKPDGHLVMTVPSKGSLIRLVQKSANKVTGMLRPNPMFEYISHSRNIYSRGEIFDLMSQVGIDPLEAENFVPFLRPIFGRSTVGSSLIAILGRKTVREEPVNE
jgi:2-polyprenyl-6-hydroxyphenyl methylase/3-demethylubiquinone-9 3-methyltransferase